MTFLRISGSLKFDPLIHANGTGISATAILVYGGGSEMRLETFAGPAQALAGLHAGDCLRIGGVIKNSPAGVEMRVDFVYPPSTEDIGGFKPLPDLTKTLKAGKKPKRGW
jgi:hypothetical protein